EKGAAAEENDQAAFDARRSEFQKHLTAIEAADGESGEAKRFRATLQQASQLAKDAQYPEAIEALTADLKDLENTARTATAAKAGKGEQKVKEPDYERRLPKILARMANLKELPGSAQQDRKSTRLN